MNVRDVDKWSMTDDPEFNMNNDEIGQSVLYDFNNIPSLKEIEEQLRKS